MWIECMNKLPPECKEGIGTVSDKVTVELSDGRIATDWLINGRYAKRYNLPRQREYIEEPIEGQMSLGDYL